MANTNSVGKAYGFFYCNAPKNQIEEYLPTIRECAQTPSKLELSLNDISSFQSEDSELTSLAQEAKQQGINYVLEANYPQATNEKTADELSAVLNQAYQSPLYETGESFKGAIVYKQGNSYIFRD
mgnify:FL=1